MSTPFENLTTLIKEGKIKEAQAIIEAEKSRSKYAPDTLDIVTGKPPHFTKKGKPVEVGNDGKWRLKD